MKTTRERGEAVIKQLIPFFKKHHFKRKGKNKFIKYGDELAYVFEIIRVRFSDPHQAGVGIGFDFFMRDFENAETDLSVSPAPLMGIDLIDFRKSVTRRMLNFSDEDADPAAQDAKIRDFYLSILEEQALPFINKVHTIRDIIQLLETTPESDVVWCDPLPNSNTEQTLATLYWILGEQDKALKAIDRGLVKFANNELSVKGLKNYRNTILREGPLYIGPKPRKKK